MSLPNSHRVLSYTRIIVFILSFFMQVSVRAWDIDLSRRQKDLQKSQGPGVTATDVGAGAATNSSISASDFVDSFFESFGPTQELVIIHTEKGFIPETVHLKKGANYKVHVVNVSQKEKNVSFVLDAFSEHHGTLFGQEKVFSISPKTEGIFSYQCPETSKQGRIIVYSDEARKPASH